MHNARAFVVQVYDVHTHAHHGAYARARTVHNALAPVYNYTTFARSGIRPPAHAGRRPATAAAAGWHVAPCCTACNAQTYNLT